jgi:hypothetical protein
MGGKTLPGAVPGDLKSVHPDLAPGRFSTLLGSGALLGF